LPTPLPVNILWVNTHNDHSGNRGEIYSITNLLLHAQAEQLYLRGKNMQERVENGPKSSDPKNNEKNKENIENTSRVNNTGRGLGRGGGKGRRDGTGGGLGRGGGGKGGRRNPR